MGMSEPTISYKNHRFPPQIIARAVLLYFRFPLSLRLVEEMLLERGIVVSYETICRSAASSARLTRSSYAERSIAEGYLASGRGRSFHQRPQALALACLRPGRLRSRRDRPGASRHQSCQAIAAQAAEEARPGAEADHHRQAALIWSRKK